MPLVIGVFAFAAYPMIAAFLLSFQRSSGNVLQGEWVGFSNYKYILSDVIFWESIYNTVYMGVLSVILGTGLSFILASLINSQLSTKAKNFFKGVFFLPNVVSTVATTLLFSFLFYPSKEGLLNFVLHFIGIGPVGWFTDPAYSRFSIVLMSLWGAIGYNTIIFIAGLQGVPRDLYEAAEVDGARPIQKWLYITIPYLRTIFLFMIIMGTIHAMKRFSDVWLIGGSAGNPAGTLKTSVLYIYRNAFVSSEMGIATASSYLLFVIIFILTIILLSFNRNNKIAIALDYSGQNTISNYKATGDTKLLDRFEAVMNLGPKGSGWVSLDPMIMAKDAKNVEAPWEVMKFFAGYDRHKHWYNNFGNSSVLTNQDYVDPKDKFAATAKKIAGVSTPTLMDEANPFFSSEIVPAINGFVSKAASGSAPDIQTFLDDLQKRAEKWSANQK